MTKNFKSLINELYVPKSDMEKHFLAKHVIKFFDYPVKNVHGLPFKDDRIAGPHDEDKHPQARPKEIHYEPGEDTDAYDQWNQRKNWQVAKEDVNEAREPAYHSVFVLDKIGPRAGKWAHQFDADTKDDARDEAESQRNQGYKTKIIRVPKNKANWGSGPGKVDPHDFVMSILKEEEDIQERNGGQREEKRYHTVFYMGQNGRWQHHFDADNKEDASDEARSLRDQGVKVKVLRVPRSKARWGTKAGETDPHDYVTNAWKEETEMGKSFKDFINFVKDDQPTIDEGNQTIANQYMDYCKQACDAVGDLHAALKNHHQAVSSKWSADEWNADDMKRHLRSIQDIKDSIERNAAYTGNVSGNKQSLKKFGNVLKLRESVEETVEVDNIIDALLKARDEDIEVEFDFGEETVVIDPTLAEALLEVFDILENDDKKDFIEGLELNAQSFYDIVEACVFGSIDEQVDPLDLQRVFNAHRQNMALGDFKKVAIDALSKSGGWKKHGTKFTAAINGANHKDKVLRAVTNYSLAGQGYGVIK